MIYHGDVELAPDFETEELDPWLDPDEEYRLRLLREERELDRLEVSHMPTDRERALASNKYREYVAERIRYRRDGIARSSGSCRKRTNLSGTTFKGRRGANKRAQANKHRRESGFARP